MTGLATAELRRRAAQLARAPTPRESGATFEAVVLRWDDDTYLLPTTWAGGTASAAQMATVPGARPPLLGACAMRSRVLPVIDLRRLCGRPAAARPVERLLVVDDRSRPSLALAVDEVTRLVRLRVADLHEPPDRPPVIRAVTAEGASLLDADWLLDLPPFFLSAEGTR